MKKIEFCRKVTELGKAGQRTVQYYIITNRYREEELCFSVNYGIGIKIIETGEETSISGITTKKAEIVRLADLLASNFVTPITLNDVVYDWLCV